MSTTTNNQSFVFYETFLIAANELEGEDKIELLQAILEYGLYETEPTFKKKYMNAIWIGIKTPIDGAKKRRKFAQENGSKSTGNKTVKKAITDSVSDSKSEVVSEATQVEKVAKSSYDTVKVITFINDKIECGILSKSNGNSLIERVKNGEEMRKEYITELIETYV